MAKFFGGQSWIRNLAESGTFFQSMFQQCKASALGFMDGSGNKFKGSNHPTSEDDWDVQSPKRNVKYLGSMKPFSEGEPGSLCNKPNRNLATYQPPNGSWLKDCTCPYCKACCTGKGLNFVNFSVFFRRLYQNSCIVTNRVTTVSSEILHQLIGIRLSHHLQSFIHPSWCRISEPSTTIVLFLYKFMTPNYSLFHFSMAPFSLPLFQTHLQLCVQFTRR